MFAFKSSRYCKYWKNQSNLVKTHTEKQNCFLIKLPMPNTSFKKLEIKPRVVL